MPFPGNPQERLEDLAERIERIESEIETIERSYGSDVASMPSGHARRYQNSLIALERAREEYDSIERALRDRERRLELVRSNFAAGYVEHGVGATFSDRRSPEFLRRGGDPYDTDKDFILRSAVTVQPDDVISRAQRAVEGAPRYFSDAAREGAMRLLDAGGKRAAMIARHMLLTGSPEYHDQFEQYVRTQGRVIGPDLVRALALSPDTAGGALVPFHLDPQIILSNAGIEAGIRALARVETIATDSWNGVTSDGVVAAWLAESTAASDASPTVAAVSIPVHKAAAWVFGSYEVLADSNFAQQLGTLLADAKMRLEGEAFATGSGSGQPTGLVTRLVATTASRVASQGATMSAVDIFNIANAASPRHASSSVWFANKSVYNQIRQFATVTTGGTFWVDMGVGRPSQLIGAATYEESSMDRYMAGTTSTLIALADPKNYIVVDRLGTVIKYVDVVFNTNTKAPTGEAGWFMYFRTGGDMTAPGVSGRVYRQYTTTSGWA